MELIKQFGERWARNSENIEDKRMPGKGKGGQGVYILYDGSTPVYIGKGNIRQRLREADRDKRRRNSWDRFSWYVIKDKSLIHDVEVLLIRILPFICDTLRDNEDTSRLESSVHPKKSNRRLKHRITLVPRNS